MSSSPPFAFYYLENFERALSWVRDRYGELLSFEELGFEKTFAQLPHPSRALLVRLLMRVGTLFRESKIQYAEIGDLSAAIAPLVDVRWVEADPAVTLTELTRLLPKEALVKGLRGCAHRPKSAICAELELEYGCDPRPASRWPWLGGERLFEVSIAPLAERFRLLFFGNVHQDWKEFVLTDLGIFNYEPIDLNDDVRAFHRRCDIEAFYAIAAARRALRDEEPLESVLALLPDRAIDHEWLEEHRSKVLFSVARQYEREGSHALALALYERCTYVHSRVRQVRLLERIARYEEALALAEASSRAVCELERQLLERARDRLQRRLQRRLGLSTSQRINSIRGSFADFEVSLNSWNVLELSTAEQLAQASAPVFYVENTLLNALFGLLHWDAIFVPLPGAFFHPFQSGPADLWSASFRSRRLEQLARCTEILERGEHAALILDVFRRKHGTHNPFVGWTRVTQELLDLALRCIPSNHLKWIFDRMMADLRNHTTGLPDLIQFYPHEGRYRMIEVKGPGDRLQDHQRRWMSFFREKDIPAYVCRVRQEQRAA